MKDKFVDERARIDIGAQGFQTGEDDVISSRLIFGLFSTLIMQISIDTSETLRADQLLRFTKQNETRLDRP